jgi:hypothetical protein
LRDIADNVKFCEGENMSDIGTIHPDWAVHAGMTELGNTLMRGTWGMQRAGEKYLPRKKKEDSAEYLARLKGSCLDNFFKRTVDFYLGQVFQKDVNIQEWSGDGRPEYDVTFFEKFKENVNLAGDSLNTFSRKVFRDGLVDGVVFVLVDHTRFEMRELDGKLEYKDSTGSWQPKSPQSDIESGARPYLIKIKADQVMDVWRTVEDGKLVIKHFRYFESVQIPKDADGLDREDAKRIVAWWPDKWEIWIEGNGTKRQIDGGPNTLGFVPVAAFMPGEEQRSMTALPPLQDLAAINRVLWEASSDHDQRLMPYVRCPPWVASLMTAKPGESIEMGPSTLLMTDREGAKLESVGVDPDSVKNSEEDIKNKREAMREYGLQAVIAHVTATLSDNAASTASSSLKGWAGGYKDFIENIMRFVAIWMGWPDGPAVVVNTRFRYNLDINLLTFIFRNIMPNGPIKPSWAVQTLIEGLPNSDEFSLGDVYDAEYVEAYQMESMLSTPAKVPGPDKEPAPVSEGTLDRYSAPVN